MHNQPLVSIIIDNYNYARFLAEAIESALAQTYPCVEVIVVDDGSTDESPQIIARYDGRIMPILKTNEGQASAFNAGLTASSGDIVIFLDADDVLMATAVERAVCLFESPDVAKVHWHLREIDENGDATGRVLPSVIAPSGYLLDLVVRVGPFYGANPPTSGNAWARSFLNRIFPIQAPGDKHGADAYLCTLAPVYGTIRAVPEPQGLYRSHRENFSGHTIQAKIERDLRRYDAQSRWLEEHLARIGIQAPLAAWKGSDSYFTWMEQLLSSLLELDAIVRKDCDFILVDDTHWGPHQPLPSRRARPFLERDGQYWGPPPDDETAIRELERLRIEGATHIVFAWPAYWWLDYYRGFRRYLEDTYPRSLVNDRLVAFELRTPE